MTLYPGFGGVEFLLGPIRAAGMDKEADDLLRALSQVADGKRLTEQYPQVPCSGLIAHWATFEKEILPKYVAASRAASKRSPEQT